MNTLLNQFHGKPLLYSLLLGFLLRSLAAIINFGPATYDDVQNIIDPALKFLQLGEFPEVQVERFTSFPVIFYLFMLPLHLLGVTRVDLLVSSGYFFVGLISLLQIWGLYKIGSLVMKPVWRNYLTLIAAIHFLSPFYGTRVELDYLAMTPITWAVYFLIKDNEKYDRLLAGFLMSLTVYIKFTVAPLYFVALVYFLFADQKNIRVKNALLFCIGGAITAAFMISEELLVGRGPLSTAISFLSYNVENQVVQQNYGEMPWYTYFLLLLGYFIPPLSIVFALGFLKGFKENYLLALLFSVFVISYTILPYKSDRYIAPIIPLFYIITFIGLQYVKYTKLVNYILAVFVILSLIGAGITATNGSQLANIKGTVALGEKENTSRHIYNINPFWSSYYGAGKQLPSMHTDIDSLVNNLKNGSDQKKSVLVFLEFSRDELTLIHNKGLKCKKDKQFYPSYAEQWVIKLNPQFNNRRRKTTLYECMNL